MTLGNPMRWISLTALLIGAEGSSSKAQAETAIEFNRDIRPILSDNCFHCHGPDPKERKAGLRLDTEEGAIGREPSSAAIVRGNPEGSELIRRIHHEDPSERMPPADSRKQLSEREKQLLSDWIQAGAPWQGHWAFEAPRRPSLPKVRNTDWPQNEIDTFILARLEQEGLRPSPPAPPETLARRATLDLTGLPPSLGELDQFLEHPRSHAYSELVARLFNSPRYGEHMAWHWLEAARYADTDGYQNDGPREMWRWRDWVIDAFNRNLPFDQFTIEQLAGDLLPHPTTQQIIATGFNRNHRYNSEAGLVFEEFLLENAVDRVDTTSTVWMGLTMGCARCHDHKYDPLPQKEYYQLLAYFNNIPESGRAIKFGNSEPWIKAPTPSQKDQLNSLQSAIDHAQARLDRSDREIQAAQEQWEASFKATDSNEPVGIHGLSHRYAKDQPLELDGGGVALEKISHLICNGRFSITFWMDPKRVHEGAVLSNEQKSSGRNGILVAFHQGHLRFHIISRWVAGVATLETISTIPQDEWMHVALTNDGSQRAKGMAIYLNGQRTDCRILHNSNSNKSGEQFGDIMRVGASPHVSNWRGRVSDLRFYHRHTLYPDEAALIATRDSIEDIVRMPPEERTQRQAEKIRRYYLRHEAPDRLAGRLTTWEQARADYRAFYDSLPTTMVMEEMPTTKSTYVRRRGVYHQKGERVDRGVPQVLSSMPPHYPRNRLGLARWLVDGRHPLTARVIVNRYWQQFFGRGLVSTPEDFGVQGALPSHPELLDWLAVEFVEHDWNIQHLIGTILHSATYQQSSAVEDSILEHDPKNILLSHAPRRRLRGNVLRDQALQLSGLLIESQGGPSVKPFQPENLWKEASNFTYQVGTGADLYRRSLYTYWKRTLAPPAMAILDTADREWCSVRPKQTNTPLQALALLNERAFVEAAVALGRHLHHMNTTQPQRIAHGFRLVTGRSPTSAEQAMLEQALDRYHESFRQNPKDARVLLKAHIGSPSERESIREAALVALANVLLNLDETTTRE